MAEHEQRPGYATDAAGAPVVDPTKNVLDLVEAAVKRLDDLMAESDRRQSEIAKLRDQHSAEVLDLRAKLGEKEAECSREMAELRANHASELRAAETERLDAIRRVDVEASQRDKEAAAVKADTLAKQVQDAAVVMRGQVDAAAAAAATSLRQALEPITRSVEDLRRTQAEDRGQKTQVVETQARGANSGLWIGLGLAAFFGFVGLIGTAVAIVVATSG